MAMTSNDETATTIDEIASGIYRISTPVPPALIPGGFTFNQYLIVDEAPLLYHTGPRKMFPLIRGHCIGHSGALAPLYRIFPL